MDAMDFRNVYASAHLFVAAIRVIEYRQNAPATVENICNLLKMSAEKAQLISRRLKEAGILEGVEGAFGERLNIINHLAIEDLPREETENKFDEELKRFTEDRKQRRREIESFAAKQEEKKKKLFASLEKQLKKDPPPK